MKSKAKWAIKHFIIFVLKYLGILRWSRNRTTRNGFIIIGWHGVSLEDEHQRFRTLFISPEQFEHRIRFLHQKLSIASLDQCLSQKKSGVILSGQVVLTFDDGYYNFLQKAVPILDKYNAPAVNYIVSARMLDERSKPNLVLRDCIQRTDHSKLAASEFNGSEALPLTNSTEKRNAEKRLLKALENLSSQEKDRFVDQVGLALGIDTATICKRRFWNSMTVEEVRELANSDHQISLQLHSHEHVNAIELGDMFSDDLSLCRAAIESATGLEASDFCYPSGIWSRETWPALEENNVRSAVTTKRGPNFVETPNLSLRRIMDGGANSQLEFELEVSGLKWLVHSWFHPEAKTSPGEKHRKYKDDPNPY